MVESSNVENLEGSTSPASLGYRTLGLTHDDTSEIPDGLVLGRVSIVHGANAEVIWFEPAGGEVVTLCHFSPGIDPRPVAGDWVAILDDHIETVLARRSALRRANLRTHVTQVLAANLDLVLLVIPIDRAPNIRMLERFAVMALDSGARPFVLLTKADESSDVSGALDVVRGVVPDVDVLTTSSISGEGIEHLRDLLHLGVTAVMLGASGAGKTSLLNALEGSDELTRTVSRGGEGRHATSTRKLYRLRGGGVLLDIPGIRLANLDVERARVDETFSDIDEVAAHCRFRDCAHTGDEGCAVEAAVEAGTLDRERLASWRLIRDEAGRSSRERGSAPRPGRRVHRDPPSPDDEPPRLD